MALMAVNTANGKQLLVNRCCASARRLHRSVAERYLLGSRSEGLERMV